MSPVFVVLGLLALVTGTAALAKPGLVFRPENAMYDGDDDLTDREAALVQRGAGAATVLLGLALLFVGLA
ncbi:hypothetical protein [Salarchaeum sp. JOR-1]|uniref:hypothetical protein n=1 Tax=Salarchaeum sp. JOR-1 TaxID=2599399 RepID=UPI001198B737|nr:hypothetical protein [Salarchaeum sp. JOR-1]QDX41095.1 hypothetical protein FQU85_09360 [Salarchaeum sp. JOR-1]